MGPSLFRPRKTRLGFHRLDVHTVIVAVAIEGGGIACLFMSVYPHIVFNVMSSCALSCRPGWNPDLTATSCPSHAGWIPPGGLPSSSIFSCPS